MLDLSYFFQDPETAEMQHQMDQLLDAAYRMIDTYERRAERQADHIALETALAAYTEADLQSERTRSFDAGSLSDQDSFVSATDVRTFDFFLVLYAGKYIKLHVYQYYAPVLTWKTIVV